MGPLANSNTKYLKGANPYWNINLDHPNYDAFWQARSIWKHFKAIKPAVLTVGGWYDAEDLQGPLRTYQTIEQTSPGRHQHHRHGPVDARQLVARRRRQGRPGHASDRRRPSGIASTSSSRSSPGTSRGATTEPVPEALMFVTGLNEWRRHETWPPKAAQKKTLYLAAGGSLGWQAPAGRWL